MSKCKGCGVLLQNGDKLALGYTSNINNDLCERCFRIRNYNDYKFVFSDNDEYIKILNEVSNTNDLVILVVDLFNISNKLNTISNYITNDVLLVLTKRDILPRSCYDKKFINYFNNFNLNIVSTIVISSKKNYNIDLLYNEINKYKKSNDVYVVGFTNAGKSTLINKFVYNYSKASTTLTTSNLPSTTIDVLKININDNLNLIDTPGLLDSGDISNNIDVNLLKKIIPTSEIKPRTYQIKVNQNIFIEDFLKINVADYTSLTFYISNNLEVTRTYKTDDRLNNFKRYILKLEDDNDIVIQGLGFIKCSKECSVIMYLKYDAKVFVRKSLI